MTGKADKKFFRELFCLTYTNPPLSRLNLPCLFLKTLKNLHKINTWQFSFNTLYVKNLFFYIDNIYFLIDNIFLL